MESGKNDNAVARNIENAEYVSLAGIPTDPVEYQALEKKLVRKIDWRLMPILVAMIILK